MESFLTCLDCGGADHERETVDSGGTSVFRRAECVECGNAALVHTNTAAPLGDSGHRVLEGEMAELTAEGLQTFRENLA